MKIEQNFEVLLTDLQQHATHLPSRIRSLLWILAGVPVLAGKGIVIAPEHEVRAELEARLPKVRRATATRAVAIA